MSYSEKLYTATQVIAHTVIPAKAGIQASTGYRIKSGMTNGLVFITSCIKGFVPHFSFLRGSIFLDLVNLLVHLGVCAMGLQIGGDIVDLFGQAFFDRIYFLIELALGTVYLLIEGFNLEAYQANLLTKFLFSIPNLFAQNVMSFNDNVQFVLEIFGLDSKLMAELGLYFFFEVKDDLFETFEIFTIHLIVSVVLLGVIRGLVLSEASIRDWGPSI
jgi:hypothetical protein